MLAQSILTFAALVVVLLNALVTWRVIHSREAHKPLIIVGVWVFPLLGAILGFFATRQAPISPYPLGGDQNPPGSGAI